MTSMIFSNSIKQKQQQQKQKEPNKTIQKRLYRESFEHPPTPPPPPPRNYYSNEKCIKKHQKDNQKDIETKYKIYNDLNMDEIMVVPEQNDNKLSQELLINEQMEFEMQLDQEMIDECEIKAQNKTNENEQSLDDNGDENEEIEEEIVKFNTHLDRDSIVKQFSQDFNESDSDSDDSESEEEDYSNDDSDDSDYIENNDSIKRSSNGRYYFDNNSYFYQRAQQPKQYHIYADNSLRMELIEILTIMKNNEREKPNVEEVFVHEIIL
ncbi:hypothetical protein DICPUDRAFT_149368 [Dictyostelium purpureum]|uniref:Uncharacterized protein n=1 Tax=Dictyostelium purpureum TaxID=5786 RepID=F0ZDI8_DICPU|nr:uncharacterized protein DICPUDRAFT_149368 [Dictyostelium purpureum]EGC37989.1 hypothetical protein DICPUDRAFT_149368 [Dictyostelium purpureum]|eukprot:XP_003285473.1 hypothetical protein DICPUDRAFT_149368 [Dictyostelium purpureum]